MSKTPARSGPAGGGIAGGNASVSRAWAAGFGLAAVALLVLYFRGLAAFGLVGPDEPRYAGIGREMARSGDWTTPRLWGEAWFEKPPLLYWMTAAGFRLGLGPETAPRLPVAIASVLFLVFFYQILRRQFGEPAGRYAALILATSAGWIAYTQVAVTDMPMAAAFSGAMLLAIAGARPELAGALLGLAVLGKGLVPLVLALPLLFWKRRISVRGAAAFLVVAAPWYLLCWSRNGDAFLREFFWKHHFARFSSDLLQHQQPFWFYLPVLLLLLLPWAPLLPLLGQRAVYRDVRARLLLAWALFGFLFFSASRNKLPGYLLPILPAVAALMGIALAALPAVRVKLAGAGLLLGLAPLAAGVLPRALAAGISRAAIPEPGWLVAAALAPAGAAWWLESSKRRPAAMLLLSLASAGAFLFLKISLAPALEREVSARAIWGEIAPYSDQVCIASLDRGRRYGLHYYSGTPLPDCALEPRPVRLEPGLVLPPAGAARPGAAGGLRPGTVR